MKAEIADQDAVLWALFAIGEDLGPATAETLIDGMPDGCEKGAGFDARLVLDVARSIQRWRARCDERTA